MTYLAPKLTMDAKFEPGEFAGILDGVTKKNFKEKLLFFTQNEGVKINIRLGIWVTTNNMMGFNFIFL